MKTDLVGKDKPFTQQDYELGLALSQIAPGPLATQLVAYFGWLAGGFWWALGSTLAFTLPSFITIVLLAEIYTRHSDQGWVQTLSRACAPIVIAIIIKSALRLLQQTSLRDPLIAILFFLSLATTIFYQQEVGWIFLLAAVIPSFKRNPTKLFGFSTLALIDYAKLWDLFRYFFEVGAFVFGSGLVIVPFLYGGVVLEHKWLTDRQFVDAIALGMMTPGPVVISVAFIGYLVSGLKGAAVSAIGIFLPCFVLVVIPAPHFKKLIAVYPSIMESVKTLAIVAMGAILGGAILLIQKNIQTTNQILALAAFLVTGLVFKKIPDPLWIFSGAALGWLLS